MTTTTSRRRRALIVAAVFGLAGTVAVTGSIAQAADGPFVVDGLVPDGFVVPPPNPGTIPPINLVDDTGNTQELGPLNASTTKIGVIHNDAPPTLGTTNPNAQVDYRQAWIDVKREAGKVFAGASSRRSVERRKPGCGSSRRLHALASPSARVRTAPGDLWPPGRSTHHEVDA